MSELHKLAPYVSTSISESLDVEDRFDDALRVVIKARKASASILQRKMGIGYARAARLLDMMEEKGLIGPGDGARPRDVYLSKENVEKHETIKVPINKSK